LPLVVVALLQSITAQNGWAQLTLSTTLPVLIQRLGEEGLTYLVARAFQENQKVFH
jgi:hypothetical protein